MSPLSKHHHLFLVILAIQLTLNVHTSPPSTDARRRFCSQHYFDSVFFDGHSYRFVVKQPSTRQVNTFALRYDAAANRFTNFTHQISSSPYILQGGFHFEGLYVQFYYRDPVGYEDSDQMDYRAYELKYCEYQSRSASETLFDELNCSQKRSSTLLSPSVTTSFTRKHRLYFFNPKTRNLWALLHQNPPFYAMLSLKDYSISSDYRNKWWFKQVEANTNSHLYTGVFTFRGHYFIVQESVSRFGLRHQNVVRRMTNLIHFSLTESEIPINQFFNCGTIVDSPNIDQQMASLNSLMLICTSVLAAFLVLTFICTCTIFYENKRIFKRIIEMMQSFPSSSSPNDFSSAYVLQ